MDARTRADAMIRAVLAIADDALRAAYVTDLFRTITVPVLAAALDVWCARAEQAETRARAALFALVDALAVEGNEAVVQRLREEAAGESHLALDRVVRQPLEGQRLLGRPTDPNDERVPDYGRGRPLT